jgi:hypothetical protein
VKEHSVFSREVGGLSPSGRSISLGYPSFVAKRTEHYVNNKDFLDALKVYRAQCAVEKALGGPAPQMPEYLGECFLKIATHLSFKPNFMNYTYRDDMIMDGVENCLIYVHNFDPEKSKNPFSYFTTVIWYAFLRRIQKEKKHTYVKYKLMEKAMIDGGTFLDESGVPMAPDATMLNFDNVQDFIKRFDSGMQQRRAKRRQGRTHVAKVRAK